jgi:hypothetical protein
MNLIQNSDMALCPSALDDVRYVSMEARRRGFRKIWELTIGYRHNSGKPDLVFWWATWEECRQLYDAILRYLEDLNQWKND